MIALSLNDAAEAMHGQLHGTHGHFAGVSTDTRTVNAGELFVALSGPNFDAHEVLENEALPPIAAAVVTRPLAIDRPQIIVSDTRRALGELARYWRQRFALKVIGITGSAGKTTVKEMLGAIAGEAGAALVTRGNLNNDIGVPLTLFRLSDADEFAVIEMGANQPGDIAELVGIALPQIGVLTCAAAAHLEGFGDLETVAITKGAIFADLPADGIAILNADDKFAPRWRDMAGTRKVLSFGSAADVRATNVHHDNSGVAFTVVHDDVHFDVRLNYLGQHNVMNALAACAAAIAANIPVTAIVQGLARARPLPGRLALTPGQGGARIVDDSYNANPSSVTAALQVLAEFPGEHWAILGDMAELGAQSRKMHAEVGQAALDAGIDRVFAIGEQAAAIAAACPERASHFASTEMFMKTLASLRAELSAEVNILVKGSRVMALEQVVAALRATEDASC